MIPSKTLMCCMVLKPPTHAVRSGKHVKTEEEG
jgi:hypothetical protein